MLVRNIAIALSSKETFMKSNKLQDYCLFVM